MARRPRRILRKPRFRAQPKVLPGQLVKTTSRRVTQLHNRMYRIGRSGTNTDLEQTRKRKIANEVASWVLPYAKKRLERTVSETYYDKGVDIPFIRPPVPFVRKELAPPRRDRQASPTTEEPARALTCKKRPKGGSGNGKSRPHVPWC